MARVRFLALVLLLAILIPACERESIGRRAAAQPAELVLAGDGELWVIDVATGRARHRVVEELAPGDPPHRVVRRGDGFVLLGGGTYAMRDADAPLELIAAETWFFIPSAMDDRVWLAFLERDQPATSVRLAAIREVTADGRVTVPDVAPPRGAWPLSAVQSGIVYDDHGALVVWDPAARAEVRRLTGGLPGPGHGDVLVTAVPDDCGDLVLTDIGTGHADRVAPVIAGGCWGIFDAAFSPDGSKLAIGFGRASAGIATRLVLIDVASATARPIPGSEVPDGYVLVDWSATGDQVFITGGERFEPRRIVAYRLGDEAARPLTVDVGDFYDMAAR